MQVRVVNINEVKTGMILIDNDERKYVVIETNLNGDDDCFSRIRLISEEEYLQSKGKNIPEEELETSKWIEAFEYRREYQVCINKYEGVNVERVFWF